MKEAILKALEQVNLDVVERRWPTYYLDVTDRFKHVIKDTSFEELLNAFAEIENSPHVKFNAADHVHNQIYFAGMLHPGLSKLNISHNNFRSSWDLLVKLRYIHENKYELIEARIVRTQVWP